MKNILASVVIAAFTAGTVVPVSAAAYSSTSPTMQKKHTAMSMQQCVKKRMGTMKGTAAMKKAQSWCTAHNKVTKKKTATSTY